MKCLNLYASLVVACASFGQTPIIFHNEGLSACQLSINGDKAGVVESDATLKTKLYAGEHLIQCSDSSSQPKYSLTLQVEPGPQRVVKLFPKAEREAEEKKRRAVIEKRRKEQDRYFELFSDYCKMRLGQIDKEFTVEEKCFMHNYEIAEKLGRTEWARFDFSQCPKD